MSDPVRLGFVAAGKRARTLMEQAYAVTEQSYLGCEPIDGYSYPHDLYEMFGDPDEQEWIVDVSDVEAEITAVMSPSEGSREQAADLCGEHGDDPVLFESYERFLEEGEYDCALVCSPNDRHVDGAVPLLERDVDTFCEKPLAATLEGHDRIIEAADDSGGLLYVGLQRRLDPLARQVKELLADGAIGRLGMISHTEVRDPFHVASPGEKGYRYFQERSGGAILEKNCHEFDAFNWYTESDPVKVTAFGGQHVFDRETDILDEAAINVEYDDGTIASLELCLYAGDGQEDIYGVRVRNTGEFRGSKGLLKVPNETGVVDVVTREDTTRHEVGSGEERFDGHGGDYFQMHRLLQCVRGEADPPATPRDAKAAAAVAIGAERSVRKDGRTVEIDDDYDLVG